MRILQSIIHLLLIASLFSCQSTPKEEYSALKEAFTPKEKIDPQIYFATEGNKANDPNNALTEMFRKKKEADMANPAKPRPFKEKDLSPLENISHQQAWTPIEQVFNFQWEQLPAETLVNLSKRIKTQLIFDNPDLKVIELAIAAGATLPLHAQPTPSVYHILGGEGQVTSGEKTATVSPGTSVTFDSYAQKRVEVTSAQPLKILWFSWAPQGDTTYLQSGYYLTGSNVHVQPIEAVLPNDFNFWEASVGKSFEVVSTTHINKSISSQKAEYDQLEKQAFYPNTPTFKSAVAIDWVDIINIDPKAFFFANDLKKLGSTLDMLGRLAKIKSVFRVERPDSGYDLNYSYLAWGPLSKYVTHSHAICEFYYLLEGDVEYIINGQTFHAVPGNFYFHPPYYDHEMRGLKEDVPFLSISGSWIPFGKRVLFELPFYLLEEVPATPFTPFSEDFDFHDFEIQGGLKYGEL